MAGGAKVDGRMLGFSFHSYLTSLKGVLGRLPLERVTRICDVLHEAYLNNRSVFIFGNGGSAALASHMACDLGKGTHCPSPGAGNMTTVKRLKVLSLTDNLPMITAWANDASFEDIFAEQMANFIEPGDVAFAISGSGNSPNVLKGLSAAKQRGAVTVGITGCQGGKMIALLDCGVVVPADNMQQIEDVHLIIAHLIFLDLRQRISQGGQA